MYVRGDGDDQLDGWLPPYNGAAGYFGAGYPTATWAAVMKRDILGQPVEQFPPPANVPAKQTDHAPVPTFTPPPPTHAHVPAARLGADLERADLERAHLERAHDAVVEPHRPRRAPTVSRHVVAAPPPTPTPSRRPRRRHAEPGQRAPGRWRGERLGGGDRLGA